MNIICNKFGEKIDEALTVDEVAAELGLVSKSIWRRVADGRIPCVRDGHFVRILRSQIEAYIEANRTDRAEVQAKKRLVAETGSRVIKRKPAASDKSVAQRVRDGLGLDKLMGK